MLNITTRQDLMRTIVETLGVIVEEALFEIDENALKVRVVDPSHVAMIKMEVDSAAFSTWEVDSTDIGLEVNKIRDLLGLAGPNDLIEMTCDADMGQAKFVIGKIDRIIRPLDNSTLSPPNVPAIDLPCKVTLSGAELAQALKAARQVGDLVHLSLDDKEFTVHVRGGTDEVNVSFGQDELASMECPSAARSQYSLTYLLPMAKIFSAVAEVDLSFGENLPLNMVFDFHDGAGHVEYFLAPRVEGDF